MRYRLTDISKRKMSVVSLTLVFFIVLSLHYTQPGESLNFTRIYDELSDSGNFLLGNIIEAKENILNRVYHFIGKKEREKKIIVLTITKTNDKINFLFDKPAEMSMHYDRPGLLKLNPLLVDISENDYLLFENFTGIVVLNHEFIYKGNCDSIFINHNKIYLADPISKINVESKKRVWNNVFINYAKLKTLDLKNISGNLMVSGENIMNIEFHQNPIHLEYFEGNINITDEGIVFVGVMEYLKTKDFTFE